MVLIPASYLIYNIGTFINFSYQILLLAKLNSSISFKYIDAKKQISLHCNQQTFYLNEYTL
jgi:hypothetical protein